MFENVQFFRIFIESLQKVLLWPKQFFGAKKYKNTEFFADSK